MRLKGRITPMLSLRGTVSKTADVIGSNIQPIRIYDNGVFEASQGVDGFNPIYVDIPKPEWYDFTITVTSEATNGQQLLEIFAPYLTDLQGGKEVALITLMNASVVANGVGIATQCSVTRMMEQGNLVGKMTRYRSYNNIVFNTVDMTNGYSISPLAGAVYYVKVVRVIA